MARARGSNPKPVETLPRISNWEKPASTQSPASDQAAAKYADPPWSKVWRTTIRVLVQRWWLRLFVVGLVGVAVIALVVGYRALTSATESPGRPSPPGAGGPVAAAAVTRTEAANWVSANVAGTAVLACDTATCAELAARGYPAGALISLTPDAREVRRADLVVVTAAVEGLLGRSLRELTAPLPVAAFGAGDAAIQLRSVAPEGPNAYERRATADRRQRASAGAQLSRANRLELSAPAGEELRAGRVDARILTVLPALLADHRLTVESFSISSAEPPGAPLRVLDIARVDGRDVAAEQAGTVDIIRFLNAQWPPFLPASAGVVDGPHGSVLRITYPAPSPLGLLGNGR